MELELTGHQVAQYRSTHSFHVSRVYTSTTQEGKELRELPGLAAILGNKCRSINNQITENMVTPHAAPVGGCVEWKQVDSYQGSV